MTKASATRQQKRLAKRQAKKPTAKPNGLIQLPMSEELKYKLWTMQERMEKLTAQKQALIAQQKTVEAQMANAELVRAQVIQEICDANKERLQGNYVMEKADFAEGLAIFSRKKKKQKTERAS